ncbi:MAG: DJ-1/PfpI family protein, partial [Candidatus Rokubacteria bacterium]|nr:DJ-1/PfpI family protein [Candidatus Rokubacteria bacterium]
GVTAGIDLALRVVAEIAGRDAAEAIQLSIEYDPHPPFDAGSPDRARQDIVRQVTRAAAPMMRDRAEQVRRAAAALDAADPGRGALRSGSGT